LSEPFAGVAIQGRFYTAATALLLGRVVRLAIMARVLLF
jgi:hypothetical protein